MKKICIFGAGAIGGYLACTLKNTNNKISIVARGQHKEIIEKKGTKIAQDGDKDIMTPYDNCLLMMPNHSPGAGVRKLRLCQRS